ncbi:hypothetical protein QMK17_13705 [Rhodococcus sp. G-MC3]|uniref:hypothetical protein n=1 Tax=Rhodococcus sp. G-MC3 TaxID=3046209 RepID=UPI0024BB6AE5|nr:hypothetical protein [Rhodococcus sp. G-MC3]MDJ0394383.1 hypothetical protein [Rhodococcus sp. G-MC3]
MIHLDTTGQCHGTLVIHAVGDAECTEPDCVDHDYVLHSLVLDCAEISGGCQCVGEIELVRAS